MVDKNFWRDNAELLEQRIYDITGDFVSKMNTEYRKQMIDVEKEINFFINKYANENGLTYAEASKNLTKIEKKDYIALRNELTSEYKKTGSERIKLRLKELEARSVITRLDSIKNQIEIRMEILAEEVTYMLQEHLKNIYRNAAEETDKNILVGFGLEKSKLSLTDSDILGFLAIPISSMLFSERIAKCTAKLSSTLIETLQTGIIQSKKAHQIAKDIKDKLTNKKGKYENYDLKRVTETESQFTFEEAINNTRKVYGIKKYMIVTARDERTCRKCAARDGEIYLESERIPRVTAPPFHPLCRCFTVEVTEDMER